MESKQLNMVALLLLVIGGINWGLVGLLKLNLVSTLFGDGLISTVVYVLVGVSAVYIGAAQLTKTGK